MKAWYKKFIERYFRSDKKNLASANYFVHIPKTAGTSFIVLLDRFYPADKIYPHQLWREAKDIDLTQNQKYDLYRGHFGGGGVGVLTDRHIDFFTILRDPVALANSTFQFVKRETNTKVHQLVEQQDMSFSQFLSHPMTSPLVQNRMVRNISFDFVEDPAAQEVFLSAETIEYLQSIIQGQGLEITDEQRLERAKKFIQQCRWFGLLERFDESLQLLCFEMYWPPIGQTQKLNTFKQSSELTVKERRLIDQLNQYDNLLYDHSVELFEDRIENMRYQLKKFQTYQSQTIDHLLDIRYQKHHAKVVSEELPDALSFGFDQVLFGSQWHRRELMQPENEYFRWTGPGAQASIDCWVQPLDYQLSIRIINATSIELLEQLNISINGHSVEWKTGDSGLVRILTVDCPVDLIKNNGLVRVVFTCHDMLRHADVFNSDDERLVGVAVHWLKFSHES